MKKIISILLIFSVFFSFAACSGKNDGETTTAPPPVIEKSAHSKEFKNAEGKTVIKIDVVLPQIIENCDEKVKNYINGEAMKIFENACDFAQRNIENASNFMTSQNSTSPWTKRITFEATHLSNRYACFIVKDALSYSEAENLPVWSTKCFDIKTGAECKLSDFSTYYDDPALGFEFFISDTLASALPRRFTHSEYINEEVLSRLGEFVYPENFYLTDDGLGIYFDQRDLDPFLFGTYKISFTWDEIAGYYELPVE